MHPIIRGIKRALNAINLSENDRMRIVLRNPTLNQYTSISFRTLDQLDIEADIIDKFEQMLQSGDTLFFADELEISIIVTRRTNKKGSGFLHRTIMSLNRWLDCIDNKKDKMCFAQALSVTMGYVKYKRGELSGSNMTGSERTDQINIGLFISYMLM